MNSLCTDQIILLCLGGSISTLIQEMLTHDRAPNNHLIVKPVYCGKSSVLAVIDEIQHENCLVIAVGFAGGVSSELNIGDIVIPYKAIDMLTRTESAPDKMITRKLARFGWARPLQIHYGVVWTSQNIIHADSEEKAWLAKEACMCVDMETYWLYSEASKCSIRAAAILIISDHVYRYPLQFCREKFNKLPQSNKTATSVREALNAIIATLS